MKIFYKFFLFPIFLTGLLYSQTPEWLLYQLSDENSPVTAITEGNDANMWFADEGGNIYKLEGNSIIIYDSTSPGFTDAGRIWGMAVDQQNNLWIATQDTGLIKFDGTNWTYFNMLEIAPRSIRNSAWDVEVDEENNIWVGTYWAGLAKYDGKEWTIYDDTNSPMPSGQMEINVIHIDSNGNLWYGSDHDGGGRFDRINNWIILPWQNYVIYSIAVEKTGVAWFTFIIPRRLENDFTWTDYNNLNFISPIFSTYAIAIDSNNLKWFAKDRTFYDKQNGVITFDDEDVNELFPPFAEVLDSSVYVYSVFIDKDNNKWLGYTNGYVVKYTGDNITDMKDDKQNIPDNYILSQNYPNPFNPTTVINYQIPQRGFVTLKIFDVLGKEVATLVNEEKPAGKYAVDFSSKGIASGVYIYRMKVNDFSTSKKMILLR